MKNLLFFTLAIALTGCAGLAPAAPTPAATLTPQIIIQTVLVTVIPTREPTQTPTSTTIPTLTPQIIVVTATGGAGASASAPSPEASATQDGATQASAPQAQQAAATTPTATLPANAGGDLFTNLTRSSDHLALRCLPETITFGVSTSNPYVTSVDIYYRIEDRLSVSISNWHNGGTMVSDKNGNFTMDFPSDRVDPDLRSHRAWLDYQFVGLNKIGDAVGRSAKISKQITYTIDCSD
jgi:hypothetical protein